MGSIAGWGDTRPVLCAGRGAIRPVSSPAGQATAAGVPPRAVFLAPHYDDVALSCGGTVAALADAGARPLVVTVFGGEPGGAALTDFARWQHERWGTAEGADTLATRRAEDREAAAILGAETRWLPHFDAIYRGDRYLSDDALFGPLAEDEVPLAERIAADILALPPVADAAALALYVPLALGNHVDHQLAYAAGRLIAARVEHARVLAYEDFPYAAQDPQALPERLAALGGELGPVETVDIARTLDRRIAAIAAYRSQLAVIFRYTDDWRVAVATFARRSGDSVTPAERFWPLNAGEG